MSGNKRWYVVHTQPNHEGMADINLRRQGFTTYLPRYLRERRHARRTTVVPRPLFPRYLFVTLDLACDRWHSIQSSFGVSRLVVTCERPLPVPDGVVDDIRARENGGFVALGLPAGVGPGSRVRLIDGIFTDCRGIVEHIADQRRVAILLEMFGREVRVLVPAASVGTV